MKGTVPHEQSAKFGGAEVFIKPASTGTGVVAGGAMRAVLESVGITDVLAKSKRFILIRTTGKSYYLAWVR